MLQLKPEEIRVLGCLVEKQKTTPDQYPLTVNALRLACNQATNRDPVVDYDETTVRETAQSLGRQGLTRFTSGHGSRVAKYRHIMDEALSLAPDEIAVLAVLMLRGAQTPGELKARTERMHGFEDLQALNETLGRLVERELVIRHQRRPGQKEQRYSHTLGADEDEPTTAPGASAPPGVAPSETTEDTSGDEPARTAAPRADDQRDPPPASLPGLAARVTELEETVAQLQARLRHLEEELGG